MTSLFDAERDRLRLSDEERATADARGRAIDRNERLRAKLVKVASEHPDETVRAQAREGLSKLPTVSAPALAAGGMRSPGGGVSTPAGLFEAEQGRLQATKDAQEPAIGTPREPERQSVLGRAWDAANAGAAGFLDWFSGGTIPAASKALGGADYAEVQSKAPEVANVGKAIGGFAGGLYGPAAMAAKTAQAAVAPLASRVAATRADLVSRGALASAPLATRAGLRLGSIGAAGLEGGIAGAQMGALEAASRSEDPLRGAAVGGVGGLVVGSGTRAAGEVYDAGAKAIRESRTKTGEDIRLLEAMGAEPSPVPFRPVRDAEPSLVPFRTARNAPSKKYGVQPTSEGRGVLGERGAQRLVSEVEAGKQAVKRRFSNEELPRAMAAQGDRQISVNRLIERVDQQLADPSVDLRPGLREKLATARKVLTGELEPSMELFSSRATPVDTPDAPVFMNKLGTVAPRARFASEEGMANVAGGRATTVDADDAIQIPMGDVRGRVGEAPNYVMSAKKLNALRDVLDEAAGADNIAAGIPKDKHALFQLAQEIRHDAIRKEAPAIGLANRRYSDALGKYELTEQRMKSTDPESLGMQIASLGEEGSKVAGTRAVRLGQLREQFPTSERLSRGDVNELMDAPRALLAEERLTLKKLPRIGGGGSDALNLSEPVIARGVYPGANEAAMFFGTATPPAPRMLGDMTLQPPQVSGLSDPRIAGRADLFRTPFDVAYARWKEERRRRAVIE